MTELVDLGKLTVPIIRTTLLIAVLILSADSSRCEDNADVASLDLSSLLDNIVVSVSRHEETLNEAPGNVFVITREVMERYGFQTVADALSIVPGLYVNEDFSSTTVGVRGISFFGDWNSRVIVLVDGRSIVEQYSGTSSVDFPGVSIDNLERIEVVKGPASSLYGSNALFGTVNLVTRQPSQSEIRGSSSLSSATRSGGLSAALTHYWRPDVNLNAQISFGGRLGNKLYFPEFSMLDSTTLSLDDNGSNQYYADSSDFTGGCADQKNTLKNIGGHAVLQFGPWYLTGHYSNGVTGVAQSMWGSLFNSSDNKYLEQRHYVDIGLEQPLNAKTDLSAHLSYNWWLYEDRILYNYYVLQASPAYLPGPLWIDRESNNSLVAEARLQWRPTSKTTLLGGTDIQFHRIEQSSGVAEVDRQTIVSNVIPPDARTTDGRIYDVYAQLDHRLTPSLKFVAGAHFNYFSYTTGRLMPKGAVVFTPQKHTTVKFIVSRGFRSPTFYELTFDDGWFYIGNKNLDPELISNYELVLSRDLPYGMSVSASANLSNMSNLIVQTPIDSTDPAFPLSGTYNPEINQFRNQGRIRSEGMEVTVQRNPVYRLSGFAGLSYEHVKPREAEGDSRLANSVSWLANVGVSYQWVPKRVVTSLLVRYTGSRYLWDGSRLPSGTVADATLNCRRFIGSLDMSIGINNLLNQRNRTPLAQDYAPATTIEQPGRSVFLKLTASR